MGYIYCITSPSNKCYIGQTRYEVEKRFDDHCKSKACPAIHYAIKKYGRENMKFEILLQVNNKLLDYYETKFIDILNTLVPNGYNIRTGGSNGLHCEESKQRMRESKLGSNNHNFGKPRSEACKLHISQAKAGEKHHFYGKNLTYAHKTSLSLSHRKVSEHDLPMFVVYVKPRPENYTSSGYAIVNHPTIRNKYFTSKNLSDQEKKQLALNYLTDMDAVQRLNGSG